MVFSVDFWWRERRVRLLLSLPLTYLFALRTFHCMCSIRGIIFPTLSCRHCGCFVLLLNIILYTSCLFLALHLAMEHIIASTCTITAYQLVSTCILIDRPPSSCSPNLPCVSDTFGSLRVVFSLWAMKSCAGKCCHSELPSSRNGLP